MTRIMGGSRILETRVWQQWPALQGSCTPALSPLPSTLPQGRAIYAAGVAAGGLFLSPSSRQKSFLPASLSSMLSCRFTPLPSYFLISPFTAVDLRNTPPIYFSPAAARMHVDPGWTKYSSGSLWLHLLPAWQGTQGD